MIRLIRALTFGFALTLAQPAMSQENPDLRAAFAAARDKDWDTARALAQDLDPLARDLLTWMRLRDGSGVFSEYEVFLAHHPDWPGLERLRMRGEEAMEPDTPAAMTLAYFNGYAPQAGEGAAHLGEVLIAAGRQTEAEAMLKEAWITEAITQEGHDRMVAAHGPLLAQWHWARTDYMLFRWKTDDARRMLPLLDPDHRLLAQARIALITKAGNAETAFAAVPPSVAGDAGLAYDRFNYLADRGDRAGAAAIALSRSTSAEALGQPFRWAGWRRSIARYLMREGEPQKAYDLASRHFTTPEDGENYADLEWLSGYIQFKYLRNPALALRHFETVKAAVDSPISAGRANYWIARAQEALGNPDAADAAYREAARHQTGFYGILATEKLGLPLDPSLAGGQDLGHWQGAPFLQDELVRAAFLLLDAGERTSAVTFFDLIGKSLQSDELPLLGAALRDRGEVFFELFIAKAAVDRGIVIPEMYFPLHPMMDQPLPVNMALALSIARRESEFRTDAGSSVGALGLMQLMPATAEAVASDIGVDYSRARLTSDWGYNAALGSAYLAELQDKFGYSPVMMAAGYNAGPSRPEEWIDTFGDPRLGEMDVVDWIEHIPFRETRNYVQRVTESIPIYEARLSGQTGPIEFTKMLIGVKPLLRPVARPATLGQTVDAIAEPVAVPVPATAQPAAPSGPAVPSSPRPLPRPGG